MGIFRSQFRPCRDVFPITLGWQRPPQGLGVDFGSAGVKAVALGWDQKRLSLLASGQEALSPGVVRDGVVHDPESAGAALRRLLQRRRIRCRIAALAVGGSSVFVKRLPAPARDPRSGESFREEVGREAARHLPFHIEDLEFDYQRSPGPVSAFGATESASAGGNGLLVFGAAPRSTVRAHCDAAVRGGLEVARVDLEPYALFSAARLAVSSKVSEPPGPFLLVEIGASRAGVHVFGAPPEPYFAAVDPDSVPGAGTPGPDADGTDANGPDAPGELLASVQAAAVLGQTGWDDEEGEAGGVFVRRIAAAAEEAVREAGLSPPLPVRLGGGRAALPGVAAAFAGLSAGEPVPIDPWRRFAVRSGDAGLELAAGLAARQLFDLAAARNRRSSQ